MNFNRLNSSASALGGLKSFQPPTSNFAASSATRMYSISFEICCLLDEESGALLRFIIFSQRDLTLEYKINVPAGINMPAGTFSKKIYAPAVKFDRGKH